VLLIINVVTSCATLAKAARVVRCQAAAFFLLKLMAHC
jgi:hypothetical protein